MILYFELVERRKKKKKKNVCPYYRWILQVLHSSHYPPILNFNAYFLRVSLKRIEYIFPPRVIFSLIIAIDHQMTDLFSYSRRRIYIFHFCFNKRNNKKKKKSILAQFSSVYAIHVRKREREREEKKRCNVHQVMQNRYNAIYISCGVSYRPCYSLSLSRDLVQETK